LSTLYIGRSEQELIETLQDALRRNPELKLSILTDALRGTREAPNPSCASLLAPLISEFGPERVEIRMYHTPNLTGLRKKYIPKRINEGWGLQHMKLYGVDDEIILSGYVGGTRTILPLHHRKLTIDQSQPVVRLLLR
jgi:CDP-diacylglycerol---glycerol-3-phosphate 3-phosphatidyltransferase